MEYISKAERKELSNLSQELLGTRSAWQKILKEGILQPFNEPGTPARKVQYMSLPEIKAYLLKLKEEFEVYKLKMAEEAKVKATELATQAEATVTQPQTESV